MGSTGITIPLHPVHSTGRQRVGVGPATERTGPVRPGRSGDGRDRIGAAVDSGMNVLDNDTWRPEEV
jgi:hypothetical protein